MPYSVNSPEVTLTLRAEDDEIGTRTIILNTRGWSVQIGRGSQTEEHLRPQFNNAWFGSRVMSRAHAEITVDPVTREIVLADVGSMHGTYIDGGRLQSHEQAVIVQGKVITFGADILRGDLTYQALQLKISYQWSDEYAARMQHWQNGLKAPSLILDESRSTSRGSDRLTTKNSYSLDYSDDELVSDQLSDHEVEVVYESAIQHDYTKSTQVDRLLDDVSASSSGGAEQREDSAPTSPAEEHVTHKTEVLSSQIGKDDINVVKEQQSDAKAVREPRSSHQGQENELQDHSDPARVHTETIDLISEISSSDDEDEGYAELDNFSESESEQEWNNHDTKSVNIASPDELEDKSVRQNRAISPSDAAMPKQITCGTTRLMNERNRALPEIFAPLCIPSSLSLSCYGNDQNMEFATVSNCGFNKLPSIQPAPWFDQGLDFGAHPEYKFAPAVFGYQVHPLPSNSVKVSINSILDEEPSSLTTSNKRKRQAGDMDHVEQVDGTATSVIDDVSNPPKVFTVTAPYLHEAEATNIPSALDSVYLVEGACSAPAEEQQQTNQLIHEASVPINPVHDLQEHEVQAPSEGDAGAVRPRKRVRTLESATPSSSKGKNIVRYAATALLGAAVGSIGTVFGLAALPADYFL